MTGGTESIMYLHLGQNVVVPMKEIIGIFDLDNSSQSKITRQFLEKAEKENRVISTGEDIPKSFTVCHNRSGYRVYISQLSATTLYKRSGTVGGMLL